jgi:predicted PurR-regulated permease PerM
MSQPQTQHVKFDISWSAIIKVLLVIFGIYFLSRISDVLVLLFVVLIMVTALSPMVDSIVAKFKIRRWIAVTVIFGALAVIITLTMWLIVPLIFGQLIDFLNLPQVKTAIGSSDSSSIIDEIQFIYAKVPGLPTDSTSFIAFFSTVFGGIASALTIIVLSLYLLLEEDGIRKFVLSIMPIQHRVSVVNTFHKISIKLGAWLRGQLSLGLIIGVLDLLILTILGVPYALTLAMFGAITELIPYVGPFLGYAAALFVALTQDSVWGFSKLVVVIGVSIGYLLIQQAEGHFIVPKVMQKSVGLSPVIVIVAILIGAKLFGLLGVVLSIPVAAAISVIISEWPTIIAAYHSSRNEIDKVIEE